MIGQTLSHYTIVEKIGEGGMGEVYRAKDHKLRRDVAIKMLRKELASDPERLRRFEQEARAASALNHPNIIHIYDIGKHDATPYMAMEYVEGRTLRAMLAEGAIPTKRLLQYAAQIAEGLAKAHSAGIVHRDLKPENVMVTGDGYLKILDFGLAKLWTTSSESSSEAVTATKEGTILGTVGYMSPEQAKGQTADYRSDQFSLGAILYEMATGKRAFQRSSSVQTLSAIIEQEPEPVASLNPTIPSHLRVIVERCLAKNPHDRYHSTLDLAKDLKSVEDPGHTAPIAKVPLTPENKIVSLDGDDKVRVSREGGRLTIDVEQGKSGDKIHLEVPERHAFIPIAGSLVVILAVLVGFNIFGLRDRLFGGSVHPVIDSLAVLPLENLSGDPEQEYFAEGMTEALIADLAKISSLRVISRTSVMQYKGVSKALPEIARELGVNAVVEGSVMQSGGRVRITTQLIQANPEQHLWAESYERDLRNILTLQNEVARQIAREIQTTLTPEEEKRLSSARSVDPVAHEAYLKGRYFLRQAGPESIRSLEFFRKALEQDPNYALAHAGLAYSYIQFAHGLLPPWEAFPQAKAAALQALELDPNLSEAHTALADAKYHYDYDWVGAEEGFQRVFELDPGNARAHAWYSGLLVAMGRFDEASVSVKRAQRLDPLSPGLYHLAGRWFYYARRFDEAIAESLRAIELSPTDESAHRWLGLAYQQKALNALAIEVLEKSGAQPESGPYSTSGLALVYAAVGRMDEARTLVEALEKLAEGEYVPPYLMALVHAAINQDQQAFAWLDRGYEVRDAALIWINVDPGFDRLRPHPRFQNLLKRMNLIE